jgi:hypothetical protein
MMCKAGGEGVTVNRSSFRNSMVLLFGFVLGKLRPTEVELEVLSRFC